MGDDLLSRTPPQADQRHAYGNDPLQFGDLWLPSASSGHRLPLVVFIHGGWWKSAYDLAYGNHLCAALKAAGVAVWSIEYRRVGNPGGGWPGTFEDVSAGYDLVASLARTYPIDLSRVTVAGHSAGGHLAFWLAGRHHIPETSPLHHCAGPSTPIHTVVGLAGAVGLRLTIDLSGWLTFAHDKQEIYTFMGGTPSDHPDRYLAGDPAELLPFNVRQLLLQGTEDDQIPPQLPARWADRAHRLSEDCTVTLLPGADHFDVVDPQSKAWPTVLRALLSGIR